MFEMVRDFAWIKDGFLLHQLEGQSSNAGGEKEKSEMNHESSSCTQ
jgi:hypothetical protein